MKKTKLSIFILLILLSQFFLFCGKTETDIQWEEDILGYWIPIGDDNNPVENMPTYKFNTNSRGASHYAPSSDVDSFGWEIKRAQLKIYYDDAPSYYIGYDKYNSRSLFKITDLTDTSVSVIQFYSAGYQKEYHMRKSILDEDEDEF